MDPYKIHKQIIKQEKRESRIIQLSLILTIATTLAIAALLFTIGSIYLYRTMENTYDPSPAPIQKYVSSDMSDLSIYT